MKREPMGHEPDGNDWLGTTLRRSDAASPDTCLDAEMLAAWADGGLSAQAAAAVESHASNCSRCMAVLAAMERAVPAAAPRHAWTPSRLFRWLAPLTAAATAVAIWVAVTGRPITSSVAVPAENSQTTGARVDATSVPPTPSATNPEPQAKRDLQAKPDPQADADLRLRDEFRERTQPKAAQESASVAQAPLAPPSAPPATVPSPGVATDSLAGASALQAKPFALNREIASSESISPSNSLHRWRVVSSTAIERSTDGGKTWMKTVPPPVGSTTPPLTILSVRAVDDVRAVTRTSDGTELYTVDAGLTWTRVQENSTAPF